jgi:hypothetical protein
MAACGDTALVIANMQLPAGTPLPAVAKYKKGVPTLQPTHPFDACDSV